MIMTEAEYERHCEDYDGYCLYCDKIGREGGTEPDAQGYECEICGAKACMGIEDAFLLGRIHIIFNRPDKIIP